MWLVFDLDPKIYDLVISVSNIHDLDKFVSDRDSTVFRDLDPHFLEKGPSYTSN